MARCEQQSSFTLEITAEEREYLKSLLQNPIMYGTDEEIEDPRHNHLRTELFTALATPNEILQ